jgi:hypothetical protein
LAGYHFAGALAVALGAPAAHEAPVIEEKPQQVEVRVAQVAAQCEIGAPPQSPCKPMGHVWFKPL